MIKIVLILLLTIASTSEAAEIRYMPYMHEDTMTVPMHADMFIVCDACQPRKPLTLQPKQTVPKKGMKSLSMMFSKDPEKPAEPPTVKQEALVILAYNQKNTDVQKQSQTLKSPIPSVLFAFDSSVVSLVERGKIDGMISRIKGKKISVRGYTCDIGGEGYNLKLSKKRADAVGNIIKSAGVDVVEAKGMGECCSISATDKKLNRRTEIKIIDQ